jgi:hypothetical protein
MPNGIVELQGYSASNRNPFSYEKVEQLSRDILTSWLTLDEITQQLNLFEDESQDAYLINLELATRMAIEDYLGMAIFPITWRAFYGNSSTINTQMYLDLPEVTQGTANTTIVNVSYYNQATPPVLVNLASTEYFYDQTGNKVICSSIPTDVNNFMSNPIIVTWTTNANFYAQYPNIKLAGLLLLTHLYNNRSNTTVETLKTLPFGVDQLLRPYKPLVM